MEVLDPSQMEDLKQRVIIQIKKFEPYAGHGSQPVVPDVIMTLVWSKVAVFR